MDMGLAVDWHGLIGKTAGWKASTTCQLKTAVWRDWWDDEL